MVRVVFTANLRKHIECEPRKVQAATVREALEAVFADHPQLRGYILDDQSRLRKHVTAFVDNTMIQDRTHLTDALSPSSEVYVMQALSGG